MGTIPPDANASVICMILKMDSPESLSQFRHISLCNVIVKLVSKILVNRLPLVMLSLTGPY